MQARTKQHIEYLRSTVLGFEYLYWMVLDQSSGLWNPKILTKSFEHAQKMPVLDLYFKNFLQKVIFMQSLGLYYSGENTPKGEKD